MHADDKKGLLMSKLRTLLNFKMATTLPTKLSTCRPMYPPKQRTCHDPVSFSIVWQEWRAFPPRATPVR